MADVDCGQISKETLLEKMTKICQCCYDEEDNCMKNMYRSYPHKGKAEIYSDMLTECFLIRVDTGAGEAVMICENCVIRLRECLMFRKQVEHTQNRIQHILARLSLDNNEMESISETHDKDTQSDDCLKNEVYNLKEKCDINKDYCKIYTSQKKIKRKQKTSSKTSNDVLQKALERTQRNLQLLNDKCKKPLREEINQESLPEDKKERRNFLRRKNYERNVPYKLDKSDKVCKECNETFPTHKMLVIHMPQHYPNHICTDCGKAFILRGHLQKHMSRHNIDKVTCNICNKSVKKDSMLRHMQAHNGQNFIYKCYYCPERFKTYSTCINHMVNKHGHKSNEYKCHLCSKVFKVLSDQKRHTRAVHFGEKPKRNRKPEGDEG